MYDAPTTAVVTAAPRRTRKAKPVTLPAALTKARKPAVPAHADLKPWAYTGVAGTLALSGWLNGLSFSAHAANPVHGWVLGLSIPFLVLVFSRVAALCYARGLKALAYGGAAVTLSMLLLSVQHCASSIATLTGEHVALAALMALAIDGGLVVCELATVKTRK